MTDRSDFWCEHRSTRLVYKKFSNGTIHYYRQCVLCFRQTTDWLGRKALGNKVLMALEDTQDGDGLVYPKSDREWKEYGRKLKAYHMNRYGDYLNSPEWKDKRQKVLRRDRYQCKMRLKGCTKGATEVHHLTYANVGHEPLEDLLSVCHHCHESITAESRSQWTSPQLSPITY